MKRNASRLSFSSLTAALLCIGILSGCGKIPGEAQEASDVPSTSAPSASRTTGPSSAPSTSEAPDEPIAVKTKIVRVIDGDTIAVRPVEVLLSQTGQHNGVPEHTVRILGIDTPEMNYGKTSEPECGAQEATDHLEQILPVNLPVTIEYDPKADRVDRYGRSLAYVTTRGDTDAGLMQVADGYAVAWYPEGEPEPDRFNDYQAAADAAASNNARLHSQCPDFGRP